MSINESEIRQRLRLREDSRWEFKQLEFRGNRLASPSRNELAEEIVSFANADGGMLLCGVTDDGQLQGMSTEQIVVLDRLMVEISTDMVKPALRIQVHHRELDEKLLLLVEVPRGDTVYECDGRAFVRVGATKRRLEGDERLRLARNRAQGRYMWYDEQIVPETGFETLDERLWRPMLSAAGADDPRRALTNLRLLAPDESGVDRATVAGILLCTQSPEIWLPQAQINATHYRGLDRASGQLDAQEIVGPLSVQIANAVRFVTRNMRVAARKLPEREDVPEYSSAAVFEAVVNAVAHRDYAITSSRVRISMFKDRLEIDTPGQLPNRMTIEGMEARQATRNEVIASVFGRLPVESVEGSSHRRFLMERRGDGVSIIRERTRESTGILPTYTLVNDSSVVLSIPAAKLELSPAQSTLTVHSKGEPLPDVDVLVLFPNKTWRRATTNESGEASFDLYTTHLPMTVFAAVAGYEAGLHSEWLPNEGGLLLELKHLPTGGSVIFPEATGQIPGLRGRLNPKRDNLDRTYLYADNIAIGEGRQQPVHFGIGEELTLTDAYGVELIVSIVEIIGRSVLLEYRSRDG